MIALSVEDVAGNSSRLDALARLDILDTPAEQEFDRVSQLITLIFGVEIGIVSLIDAHRQWYKSVVGMDNSEAALQGSFCKHTLQSGDSVVVPDTLLDRRFADSPHVTAGPKIRFYAGMPLKTREGLVIGSVCAIDLRARSFGSRETAILAHLTEGVMYALELRHQAATDVLTGAMSRRAFKDEAAKHLALSKRHRTPMSCIVFDLDYFKTINDTYGHAAGDLVLTGIVRAAQGQLRQSDMLGRMGGEEFAVILPQTEPAMAFAVAEKLRQLTSALRFPGSVPPIKTTASFGVSSADQGDDVDSLINKADQALYQAKRSGRNRTCVWAAPDDLTRVNRRRVLKGGQIISNNRQSVLDCTVRSIWDGGAEVQVSLPLLVPDQFELAIRGENLSRPCQLIYRGNASIEVAFT